MPLLTGRLSPVSAASATSSVAAASRRPSAGTTSPASIATTSPGTSSSAGSCASAPSRRTRALTIIIFASAATAAAALPSWLRPSTALSSVSSRITMPGAELLDRVDRDHAGGERARSASGPGTGAGTRASATPTSPRRTGWGRSCASRFGGLLARQPVLRLDAAAPRRRSRAGSACQVGAVGRRRRWLCGGRHLVPLSPCAGRRPRRARRACRLSPRSSACVSAIAPMAAMPPVRSTNRHAARTFGPIEPSANSGRLERSGVALRIAALLGRRPSRGTPRRRR